MGVNFDSKGAKGVTSEEAYLTTTKDGKLDVVKAFRDRDANPQLGSQASVDKPKFQGSSPSTKLGAIEKSKPNVSGQKIGDGVGAFSKGDRVSIPGGDDGAVDIYQIIGFDQARQEDGSHDPVAILRGQDGAVVRALLVDLKKIENRQ